VIPSDESRDMSTAESEDNGDSFRAVAMCYRRAVAVTGKARRLGYLQDAADAREALEGDDASTGLTTAQANAVLWLLCQARLATRLEDDRR
jgi:hypothetical protein